MIRILTYVEVNRLICVWTLRSLTPPRHRPPLPASTQQYKVGTQYTGHPYQSLLNSTRWVYIKENKKVSKQENKKTKKERKQELDQESDQEKNIFFSFFLGRERVFFLFSCFLDLFLGRILVFLYSYILVFFYKFPPQCAFEQSRRVDVPTAAGGITHKH